MERNCRCSLPYPSLESPAASPAWIPMLKNLYAGRRSELGAITQYCYQSIILSRTCREIAETLRGMAMVEMHHMEMLGKLVLLCGGTPDFSGGRPCQWWNGSFSNRRKDLCGILLINLRDEVAAVDAYLKAASAISDPQISRLLRRIAMDESHHAQLLREMITKSGCPRKP